MSDYSQMLGMIASDGGAASKPPAFNPTGAYGTPPAMLDRLAQVESGGGKNNINPQSGAMGPYQFLPSTVAMLQKQGVNFNPMDPPQSRAAADYYLSSLAQKNGGDYAKALAAYGGFKTADPTAYVSKVMGQPQQQPASAPPQSTYAPLFNMIASDAASAPAASSNQPTSSPTNQPTGAQSSKPSAWDEAKDVIGGALEVPGAIVGGIAGSAAGGLRGLYDLATGQGVNKATSDIHATQQAVNMLTAPETRFGQEATDVASIPGNLLAKAGDYVGSKVATVSPLAGALVNAGIQVAPMLVGAKAAGGDDVVAGANHLVGATDITPEILKPRQSTETASPESAYGSAGSAAANPLTMAASASPELAEVVANSAKEGLPINQDALAAHIQAESLPVPVKLTEGQATGDVHLISDEQNLKGNTPEIAYRLDEQNKALKDNLPAFREMVAPDVFDKDHIDMGQGLIDSYLTKDDALKSDINSKYQALRDANGGDFPVDAPALYNNIASAFKTNLNSAKLQDGPVGAQMRELQNLADTGSMSMEQYLALRKNLGDIARTASDGTDRAMAAEAVRQMEELPLQGGAADLKPLADDARNAARQRFQLIESDPAYKAAINGVAPDSFINKYVINAPVRDVQAMRENLADDPLAQQRMAAGVVDHLKNSAGYQPDGNWNFKTDAYNKAITKLAPKLPAIGIGQAGEGLQALANVSRRTTFQPRGSYVNNSNTFVANVKSHANNLLTGMADRAMGGLPVVSIIRKSLDNRAKQKVVNQALAPYAGINRLTGEK